MIKLVREYYKLAGDAVYIVRTAGWRVLGVKLVRRIKKKLTFRPPDTYRSWFPRHEPSPQELIDQKEQASQFPYRPLISLIVPVWNPDARWLARAVESVLQQTYDHWELCLADGASYGTEIKTVLEKYARQDVRIKVKFLPENQGISGNSNAALALASGEFIGLLDHDDELAPFALYEVAKALNRQPDLDFLYSDEDKIDVRQRRVDPGFKPDWSPDLLLSCMYTGHFGVYRRRIATAIGGFRPGYDGSQDYDFVLRFVEKTRRIHHIPAILYHWRMAAGSAASDVNAKSYAYTAAKKALEDYLARNRIQAEVMDGLWVGSYRVKRKIQGEPRISIIIPTKDKAGVLRACLDSIFERTDYPHYEILLVDNQSREKETFRYYQEIEKHPRVKILRYDRPFNYSAINNFAVSQAAGEYVLLLNNDTRVISAEWLSSLLEQAQRPEVGAVGAKLLYPNRAIQHCGVIVGLGSVVGEEVAGHPYTRMQIKHGHMGRISVIGNYSAVTGACMLMRRRLYQEIGGLNEDLACDFNDIDLCLRLREKDYLIVYTPYAQLYHCESLTRGLPASKEGQLRFSGEVSYMRKRWAGILSRGDPYYNPNLSLVSPDFSLRS